MNHTPRETQIIYANHPKFEIQRLIVNQTKYVGIQNDGEIYL